MRFPLDEKVVARQIKNNSTIFANVGLVGSTKMALLENSTIQLPYIGVNFKDFTAGQNSSLNGLYQECELLIELVAIYPTGDDLTGGAATQYGYQSVATDVLSVMLNADLFPENSVQAINFDSTNKLEEFCTASRSVQAFYFRVDLILTSEDGFPLESTPLSEIDVTIGNPQHTTTYVTQTIK